MAIMIVVMISLIWIIQSNDSNAIQTHNDQYFSSSIIPEARFFDQYAELSAPPNSVVVYPILTQSAYSWKGIHDFYVGYCDDCTSISIDKSYDPIYSVGGNAFRVLEFLGYDVIDDIDIDKNPKILQQYDSVILLHNEFATMNQYEAIMSHNNVIYLYPGSLRSVVSVDYDANMLTLTRGPGYPTNNVDNGFDWAFDNFEYFSDTTCNEWGFSEINNGFMLNCYPEYAILAESKILEKIKELSLL